MDNDHTNIARGIYTNTTPNCIGIIMDGNRRFARRNGQDETEGHVLGYKKLMSVIQWAKAESISSLIVYGFSTENQCRSNKEVDALMDIFRVFFKQMLAKAKKNDVAISFIGLREQLPQDVQIAMRRLERETRQCMSLNLIIAAPYGGRAELVDVINRMKSSSVDNKQVSEEDITQYLWTANTRDPDLIIRTGGQRRISNFLLWQMAYSELVFTDTLWPDFTQKEFTKILYEYSLRKRTYGR